MKVFLDAFQNSLSIFFALLIVGATGIIFREYIKNYFDFITKRRESRLDFRKSLGLEMAKENIPIYREIIEVVYKLKTSSSIIIKPGKIRFQEIEKFRECCYILTESLPKYKSYLDDEIFDDLHFFKRDCQDFTIIMDISERPEELINHGPFIEGKNKEKSLEISSAIEQRSNKVIMSIKTKLGEVDNID